jgi:hypothetical protein
MKIEISGMLEHEVAGILAQRIFGRVEERRFFLSGHCRIERCFGYDFAETKKIIASVGGAAWERRGFLLSIKWHLNRLRQEKNSPPRWQTYIEQSLADRQRYGGSPMACELDSPLCRKEAA